MEKTCDGGVLYGASFFLLAAFGSASQKGKKMTKDGEFKPLLVVINALFFFLFVCFACYAVFCSQEAVCCPLRG